MDLNFSLSSIFAGIFFGVWGFWMLGRGKKLGSPPLILIGLILMIYPYFGLGPWLDWIVGFALCGVAYRLWP